MGRGGVGWSAGMQTRMGTEVAVGSPNEKRGGKGEAKGALEQ